MTAPRVESDTVHTDEPLIRNSPVVGLFGAIAGVFETVGPGSRAQVADAVRSGGLSPQLNLDNRAHLGEFAHIESPSSKPARIFVGLAFLEYLWAFGYANFVRFEWENQCRMQAEGKPFEEAPIEPELLRRALALGDWAGAMPWGYSPWPAGAPSPRSPTPGQEAFYAGKVNTVFLQATAFLLWHEVGHCVNGDLGRLNVDDATAVAEEIRADDFAYAALIAADPSEAGRRRLAWPLLLPMLALIHLARAPADLFSRRHPFTHERLAQQLRRLNFEEIENCHYFEGLAFLLFHLFAEKHALPVVAAVDNAQAGIAHYLALFSQLEPGRAPPPRLASASSASAPE